MIHLDAVLVDDITEEVNSVTVKLALLELQVQEEYINPL